MTETASIVHSWISVVDLLGNHRNDHTWMLLLDLGQSWEVRCEYYQLGTEESKSVQGQDLICH
jgi:hypothetical protein